MTICRDFTLVTRKFLRGSSTHFYSVLVEAAFLTSENLCKSHRLERVYQQVSLI